MDKTSSLSELKKQEREARRQLILQAAIDLFSTQSVSNVSIRDIAKKAGISPALIYRHFEDRDELFVEAFLKQSERIITTFEEMALKNKTLTIEEVGQSFVSYLLDNEDFFQMMTHFMLDSVLKEEVTGDFNDNMRRLLTTFDTSFCNSGIEDSIRLHSQALFSALNGVVITYRNYPGRSKEETRKHVINLTNFICSKFK